ncbi:MAG: threonine synthase [Deltaproteobacteria bacterium]|nr:threonine synthase [Deltaproteobacteria bacterium]
MKFFSTRGLALPCHLSEAIRQGLAPDGGLFVPSQWPSPQTFSQILHDSKWKELSFSQFAAKFLEPFFQEDPLAEHLEKICARAFNFPLPCVRIDDHTQVLELFHGPTSAFKDFGARFLALCFNHLEPDPRKQNSKRQPMVLVATSGDTGGAVAAAFSEFTDIPVCILYPKGQVSQRQEQQLTCWGEQVRAFSVVGTFDDCQRLAKEAFLSEYFRDHHHLISANSINLARLLPQMAYFAYTSLKHNSLKHASLKHQSRSGEAKGARFIIPSGNMGNAAAALWAQKLGFPIAKVIFAHNANSTIPDYFKTGQYRPRASLSTLANAMDVGHPSNFERILNLFPDRETLSKISAAFSVTDSQIRETIRFGYSKGQIWCPHTATAAYVRYHLLHAGNLDIADDEIIVATAHPAKFESIVEPLIPEKVKVPLTLQALLSKPSHKIEIDSNLEILAENLKI